MSEGQATHIVQINPRDMLPAIGSLIRRSFGTVAADFNLTVQNCPRHPAFLTDEDLSESLFLDGVICFGGFMDGKLTGFVAIWPKDVHTYELTRLCTAPECRHLGMGRMLMEDDFMFTLNKFATSLCIALLLLILLSSCRLHDEGETTFREGSSTDFLQSENSTSSNGNGGIHESTNGISTTSTKQATLSSEIYEYTYPDDIAPVVRKNAEILMENLGIYKELAVLNAEKLNELNISEVEAVNAGIVEGGLKYVQIKDGNGKEYCLSISEHGSLWAVYEGDMHGDLVWHVVF